MPHFKCVPCETRLSRPVGQADQVGDLCPDCGSLLEPVGELSEVVGFRSITDTHKRIAGRVYDLVERQAAIRARLDAERWLDDGGSFSPEAVAAAMALPRPDGDS